MRGRFLLMLGIAALLAGCGGGSAGGGTPGASGSAGVGGGSNNYPLSVSPSPASLTATLVQGVGEIFTLEAQVTGTVSTASNLYVVIDEPSGVLQPGKVQITELSSTSAPNPTSSWLAQIVTSTALPAGEEKGTLNVRVCSDVNCGTVYGETGIPFDFTVEPSSDATAVAALPGASDWQTGGGDASRMSYVPVTLDPSKFTVRWLQADVQGLEPAGDVAGGSLLVTDSADQLVIMTVPATQETNSATVATYGGLVAYNEADGSPVWHETLLDSSGAQQEPGPPTIAQGIVYTTRGPDIDNGGYAGDVSVTGLSARNGAVAFSTRISDTFNQQYGVQGDGCGPGSPVVSAGTVVVDPGCSPDGAYSSGPLPIAAFDATSGQSLWSGAALGGKGGTTVASDGTNLYYIVPRDTTPPTLTALSQANGSVQWQTTLSDGVGFAYTTPVLDGMGGAIVAANTPNGPQLDRYDLASGQLLWQVDIPSQQLDAVQKIAVANGMVYIGYNAKVLALNLADGGTAWAWSPASNHETMLNGMIVGTSVNAMLVTSNLLFVGTDRGVYAVDLSTHQTVWDLAVPGYELAISPSGMLYVVTSEDSNVSSVAGFYDPANQALMSVNLH